MTVATAVKKPQKKKVLAKDVVAAIQQSVAAEQKKTEPAVVDRDLGGRPTKYKPEMDEQVFKLALLGATQIEMARYFEIDLTTFARWLTNNESFGKSMRAGGDDADMEIVASLRKQAMGYEIEVEELKVISVSVHEQKVVREKVTRYIPPDYRATGRWLGNRRRDRWSEKVEVNITDPAEAARAAQAAIAAADKIIDEGEK